jgi:Helix-turn-helix.
MTLAQWLEKNDLTRAAFALRVGTTTATISRIAKGEQNIPLSLIDAIKRETGGEVTADDLHEVYAQVQGGAA